MITISQWNKTLQRCVASLAVCVALILTGCGGGGGSTSTPVATSTTISGKAVLGPLSGATIDVSTLDGNLLVSGTAQTSANLATAGSFSLSLPLPLNAPIYLVTARGGTDIDPTDSGVAGAGIPSKGLAHAYVTAAQLQAGSFTVNPLTEIIYQDIALQYPTGVTALTAAQWSSLLDTEAAKFLTGATSYNDVKWPPRIGQLAKVY